MRDVETERAIRPRRDHGDPRHGARRVSDLARILAEAGDWLAGQGSILLMTDYDGTLTPIVDDPAHASLAQETRGQLERLAGAARGRLAVISGRGLEDLRARVAVPGAIYAGCHGLEVAGPGLAFRHPDALAQQAMVGAVAEALARRAPAVAGMQVEAKGLTVAVHYRRVSPDEIRRVQTELARAIREHGSRLKIFHGAKVIEVLPQVAWTKGECACWIQEQVQPALPEPLLWLYLGDDWTDEHAFEALEGRALTIRVGDAAPASKAAYRLSDVAEVQQLLGTLAEGAVAGSRG
jgi:trehalose-phosphatase